MDFPHDCLHFSDAPTKGSCSLYTPPHTLPPVQHLGQVLLIFASTYKVCIGILLVAVCQGLAEQESEKQSGHFSDQRRACPPRCISEACSQTPIKKPFRQSEMAERKSNNNNKKTQTSQTVSACLLCCCCRDQTESQSNQLFYRSQSYHHLGAICTCFLSD